MLSFKKFLLKKTFIISSLGILMLLLYSINASANLIEPSPLDKSVEYLGTIFGNKINKHFIELNYPTSAFIAKLFEIFNSLILVVSILVLIYVTVLSTVNTAQEGQVMGKKWSSVWIPLRSSLGLLLLSPMPSTGYSCLQVAVMWVVLNGVGAADYIWNFVLTNLYHGINISQQEVINRENIHTLERQAKALAKKILDSSNCINILKHINENSRNPIDDLNLNFYLLPDDSTNSNNYERLATTINFGVNSTDNTVQKNICGNIIVETKLNTAELLNANDKISNISDTNKKFLLEKIHKIKLNATINMLESINKFSKNLINNATILEESKDIVFYDLNDDTSKLYYVITAYQQSMLTLTKQDVRSWINLHSKLDQQSLSAEIIEQGKNFGWVIAGSYYYLISQNPIKNLLTAATSSSIVENQLFINQEIKPTRLDQANLNITSSQVTPYLKALSLQPEYIRNLFKTPKELKISKNIKDSIKKANQRNSEIYSNLPPELAETSQLGLPELRSKLVQNHPQIKSYIDAFFSLYEYAIKEMEYCFKAHNDPLISQAMFGTKLMQAAETFWTTVTIGSLVSESFAGLLHKDDNHSKTGFLVTLLPVTLIFSGIIWGIGATLAVYTPMIPYMIFIITTLGWFMLVVEAVIAAPVVALGFITPSQDELGKVAPALGITINMFLKPSLMIFGLLMGSKIYSTLINIINIGFKFTFATLQAHAGSSMFAWIVVIILYTGFILNLVNKCYALIYQLPDKILRWIGLTGEQTDISTLKETQHMFDQGSKQSIAPIEGAATAAAKKLKSQIESARSAHSESNLFNATNFNHSNANQPPPDNH